MFRSLFTLGAAAALFTVTHPPATAGEPLAPDSLPLPAEGAAATDFCLFFPTFGDAIEITLDPVSATWVNFDLLGNDTPFTAVVPVAPGRIRFICAAGTACEGADQFGVDAAAFAVAVPVGTYDFVFVNDGQVEILQDDDIFEASPGPCTLAPTAPQGERSRGESVLN